MIFVAALSEARLKHEDVLFVLAHNPQLAGIKFKGSVDLVESRRQKGKLSLFVWRLNDHEVTSEDVTFVIMFSQSKEEKAFAENRFMLKRRGDEIQTFLDDLCDDLDPEDVEPQIMENGNLVYFLRGCDTSFLSNSVARHARAGIKEVEPLNI